MNQISPAKTHNVQLDQLPDEVIQQILTHLDQPDLTNLSTLSRHLNAISREQQLWKSLFIHDFTFFDSTSDTAQKRTDPAFHEWRELYIKRHTANKSTRKAVSSIIETRQHRLQQIGTVVAHGYEVKGELLRLFNSPSPDKILAQRYWSQSITGCLNRSRALEIWNKLKYRSDMPNPIELSLACLDMFMLGAQNSGDIEDTFSRLDGYAAAVRHAHPDIDDQTPRQKAITIARFLREKQWVGIDGGRDYYSIENQFLGYALRSSLHNSLPLISCVIYCYVVRQFGLEAAPCSYPMHVHAVVQVRKDDHIDLDGQPLPTHLAHHGIFDGLTIPDLPNALTHLYIDPFNTHEPQTLNFLIENMNFVAADVPRAKRAEMLLPADFRSLLVRSAHNIIHSLQTFPFDRNARNRNAADPELNPYDAAYAALYVLVLFPASPHALAQSLHDLRQHFANYYSEDIVNYEMYMLPHTVGMGPFGGSRGLQDQMVRVLRSDDGAPTKPKRRDCERTDGSGEEKEIIKYHIGTVFRHRRQGYIGVIFGWDGRCEMSERWIVGNGVDRLPRGRTQPFYNVFVDDRSTRYVAQENVIPLGPVDFSAADAERTFAAEVGRWFLRFDAATARFVSNVRDEYPED